MGTCLDWLSLLNALNVTLGPIVWGQEMCHQLALAVLDSCVLEEPSFPPQMIMRLEYHVQLGFYCSEPGLTTVSGPCLPGFYCSEGSQTSAPVSAVYGDICPTGHYCEIGSAVPTPCPVGSRRPDSGGKGTDDCMPCPGGQFQDQKGQSECKPCPPGFHCINPTRGFMGVSTPLVCPEGFYCPNETQSGNPVPCPKGTYSDSLGLISAEQCLLCPMGHFCGSDGLSEPSGPCAPGFLCFVQATVPNPTDNSTGTLCPPGAYCLLGTRAGECSAGYYCDWGSNSPEQSLCPASFYCPTGTHKPLACTAGTYSSVMGNSHRENCEPCPLGYYCQGILEVAQEERALVGAQEERALEGALEEWALEGWTGPAKATKESWMGPAEAKETKEAQRSVFARFLG
ncbi:laminin subunit gamma-2-like [Sinocyclocheilus grahami]|uniref:laminin subunit gamma-2-like n=1 Tax=Sinocyclocheilus grahami TaxID=75366 RepID=UPI0007AD3ABA|nr:PREDICTED: laminin subunit gamma-2-like [Sinocyclocheilus grahami]